MDVSTVSTHQDTHYEVLVEVEKKEPGSQHHGGMFSRWVHSEQYVSVEVITFVNKNGTGGGKRLTLPLENHVQLLVFSSPEEAQDLLREGRVIVQDDTRPGVHKITEKVVKLRLPQDMPPSGHLLIHLGVAGANCKFSCTEVKSLSPIVVTKF